VVAAPAEEVVGRAATGGGKRKAGARYGRSGKDEVAEEQGPQEDRSET